jgi:hypothetical protein
MQPFASHERLKCRRGANPKTRAALSQKNRISAKLRDYRPVVVVESWLIVLSVVIIAPESIGIGAGGVGAGIVVASAFVVSDDVSSSEEQSPSTSSDDAARTVKNERFISTSDKGPKDFDGTRRSTCRPSS